MRRIFTSLLLCACADAQAQTNPRITCAGVNQGRPLTIDFAGTAITSCTAGPSNLAINLSSAAGSGAPTNSTYITQTPDPTLSAEQAMSLLGSGITMNTTGSGVQSIYTGTSCAYAVKSLDAAGAATCTAAPATGAPASAGYWTKTADATLSNEFDMSSLATGILKNTTTTGIPTIAVAGTDYAGLASTNAFTGTNTFTPSAAATSGVAGTGSTTGSGVRGFGGATDGVGVQGSGGGNGPGGWFQAGGTGEGGVFQASGGGAAINMVPQAAPSTLVNGDQWVETTSNTLKARINGGTKTVWPAAYADITGTPSIPADISAASYITKVAEASLSNEFAMGSLATGIVKNTTTTGVPSIAVAGTDYAAATSGSAVLLGNGAGGFSNYAGTSCTNQFNRSLSTAGAATCAGVGVADFTANQGTTTQVLHGNAAGQPSWSAVAAATDITGILPVANGGMGKSTATAAGNIPYGSSATAYADLAAGTAGQALFSGGAAAPTWGDANKIIRLTADYTNATTSMTNTALTWTSPAVVSRSGFSCLLMVKTSATTTGAQFDVNVATAPTTITYELDYVLTAGTAPSTAGTRGFVDAVASATAIGPAATLTTYTLWKLTGIIVHTSTASAVTVRDKAIAAGTLTLGSGSYCTYYTL